MGASAGLRRLMAQDPVLSACFFLSAIGNYWTSPSSPSFRVSHPFLAQMHVDRQGRFRTAIYRRRKVALDSFEIQGNRGDVHCWARAGMRTLKRVVRSLCVLVVFVDGLKIGIWVTFWLHAHGLIHCLHFWGWKSELNIYLLAFRVSALFLAPMFVSCTTKGLIGQI
jgi:hypothetical protein